MSRRAVRTVPRKRNYRTDQVIYPDGAFAIEPARKWLPLEEFMRMFDNVVHGTPYSGPETTVGVLMP